MDTTRLFFEVTFKAMRSRGPGGQNVNKVSSAALLTWLIRDSSVFDDEEKSRIYLKLANKISGEGTLNVRSDEFRDFPRNKERAFEKFLILLSFALKENKPRKPTKPTRTSKVRRLESKSRRSAVKQNRGKIYDD